MEAIDIINKYISDLSVKWDAETEEFKFKWTKFWQKSKIKMMHVVPFLLHSLDGLINLVDDLIDDGKDKKKAVLNATSILYDYIITTAMPMWMRPFSSKIKDFVINVIISEAIDWIVAKYRDGSWKMEQENETQEKSV